MEVRRHLKLAPKFYRSFKTERKVQQVAYKHTLPPEGAIHPVFHVSMLKKYEGNSSRSQEELPIKDFEGQVRVDLGAIM